jgi:predicted flap endonuclease-1-like 5' DNA nuclease
MEADVRSIPGIGAVMEENFKKEGVYKCSELNKNS